MNTVFEWLALVNLLYISAMVSKSDGLGSLLICSSVFLLVIYPLVRLILLLEGMWR